MESAGPSSASGGMMAFTREPSGSRASTMGDDSSTRRPTRETMRSMICSRCRSSRNLTLGLFQHAVALDIDQIFVVDQDVRDGRILQQRLERSQAEDLIEQIRLDSVFLSTR